MPRASTAPATTCVSFAASPATPVSASAAAAQAGDDSFIWRHLGPRPAEITEMLKMLGYATLDELAAATVPEAIRLPHPLRLHAPRSEAEALAELRQLAEQNQVFRSFIGMGYYGTIIPPVIQRNILENPGWYTQYTPYQAEISQGRLEALLNFQTMVSDLTGMPLANASLLDEGTAAAEAMAMCHAIAGDETQKNTFFISTGCHPQTIAVVQARARALGIQIHVADEQEMLAPGNAMLETLCGILLQYPTTDGRILNYGPVLEKIHAAKALAVVATDLLALTLIAPPGEMDGGGADVVVGSAQRFGVPMGYGGPHAGFMATKAEYVRKMPGRLVGVSKDEAGNPAYRLALQTREQHIRREKATSNICTAQVLLAIMASMYAVYHGPEGLKRIARRVHALAATLADGIVRAGGKLTGVPFFDTLRFTAPADFSKNCRRKGINVRTYPDGTAGLSVDETTGEEEVATLIRLLGGSMPAKSAAEFPSAIETRTSQFLTHPVFNTYHCEHEMLRYIKRLEAKDLSLCQSMIPLGSCTMKLNATAEMLPITWPEFSQLHPFAPADQAKGYHELFKRLEAWLAEVTGFAAVSLQPNAGSQGEYTGLLVIRAYHEARGQTHRNVCLIPTSAHGTNPASAVTAGFRVIPIACDAHGNIDLTDLAAKAAEHQEHLACIMVTYPSTHGVFEEGIREICRIVHQHGGQVYMDGANMNAQVGLTSPGFIGADVCHLNLHKTFCIPHGGGGPGVGPIAVAPHLAAHLPGHPIINPSLDARPSASKAAIGPVTSAPWGSAGILPISYAYIAMMGTPGLTLATQVAILNANYMAKRLEAHYPVVFKGKHGRCAHEFILNCHQFEASAGVKVEDIAKRLMDYGFHAPTMSWPEPGTLMIEPTESESKQELDRLCDALIAIRQEIREIEEGRMDPKDNPLKHAPHTAQAVSADTWEHRYSRQAGAYPAAWQRVPGAYKFWPSVGRIDNPYGDRNLLCTCPPVSAFCE